jgi:DNA-binding IclR family transcriptional regulator
MPDPSAVRAYATRNTLHALEVLAAGPCSAPELASRLLIGDRSARKLLQRCALEGWASQGDWHHRRYEPTLRLAAIARQLLDEATLFRHADATLQGLAECGGEASLWIRDAGRERALCVFRCAGGGLAAPFVDLGAPVPLASCGAGRVLAGGVAHDAAPVFDERGTLIAAVALTPARPGDADEVAAAGRMISELIRDGVL